MLRHGSSLWSQIRNGVSGLILKLGGELGLFLEEQQGVRPPLVLRQETRSSLHVVAMESVLMSS